MAVANETILKKMALELQQANNHQSKKQLTRHIENIKLLCELILSEESVEVDKNDITAAEMKAMIGEKQSSSTKSHVYRKSTPMDHDDSNGDSIFDF